jgi:hypothetical protein
MDQLSMRISSGIAPVQLREICIEAAERVLSGRVYTFYKPEGKKLSQDVRTGEITHFRGLLQVSSDVYITIWTGREVQK